MHAAPCRLKLERIEQKKPDPGPTGCAVDGDHGKIRGARPRIVRIARRDALHVTRLFRDEGEALAHQLGYVFS